MGQTREDKDIGKGYIEGHLSGSMVLVQLYPRVFAILYIQLSYLFKFQAKILQRQIIYTAP